MFNHQRNNTPVCIVLHTHETAQSDTYINCACPISDASYIKFN